MAVLKRACALLGIAALLSAVSAEAQAREPRAANEYTVKAAILFNLLKFVEWPAGIFADGSEPLTLCILGADPFGPVLDESARGRLVSGRAVLIRRIADTGPGCHALFIAASERKRLPIITDRLKTASVLTVSEDEGFTDHGGMIELNTNGERVHFTINTSATDRARLKISARLLALATSLRRRGENER